MADWTDFLGDGDTAFGYDSYGGDSVDWGDWLNSGADDAGFDWGSLLGGDSSSSSGWGSVISGLFGGGEGSSGNSSSLWASLLGGLGGAAQGYLSGKDLKESIEAQGKETRKNTGYTADLADFYKQKDKVRKRTALDTYGQFSLAGNIASPGIDMPSRPGI